MNVNPGTFARGPIGSGERRPRTGVVGFALAILAIACLSGAAARAQTLETETARLLPRGVWQLGATTEAQFSSEGQEYALPLLMEYGIRDTLEIMVEPVAVTAIRSNSGPDATGIGDIETTLTWRFHEEKGRCPAFATAFEVKIPTAQNELIGTGKFDFAGYFILSRRFGKFDLHANLSYTVIGQPSGVSVNNVYGAAIAGVYQFDPKYQLFGEFYGNSSANGSDAADTAVPPPVGTEGNGLTSELASQEIVGSIGFGGLVSHGLLVFGSVGYDNNHAAQARVGFTIQF